MPYGITQCYLPPDKGDIPALTPAAAGTRLWSVEEKRSSEVQAVHTDTASLPQNFTNYTQMHAKSDTSVQHFMQVFVQSAGADRI